MTKKTKNKNKPQKVTTVPPSPATSARAKDVPVDPDENMKWMTAGRLVLAGVTVVAVLAVRGWMSLRGAGNQPGPGPVRDASDVLQSV
jgi:hypothetical protein